MAAASPIRRSGPGLSASRAVGLAATAACVATAVTALRADTSAAAPTPPPTPASVAAAPAILPQAAPTQHLGVGSCSGSSCHGASQAWQRLKGAAVAQDEYVTWQRRDQHARAYEVLMNERSRRIARNLGINAAHTSDLCLDCHSDNVPAAKRGPQFRLSDGVGCEACHGGAMKWMSMHVSGKVAREKTLAAGMYPTDDPLARARLCLSCHLGTDKKFVTHRLMGAGHPRFSFELDTFGAIQPAHHVVDADYRERKRVTGSVQTWAIGQALAVSHTMDRLLDPGRSDGLFPELVFYDCHGCHHPMSDLRWQPRRDGHPGPGLPRFNDANLIMLSLIAERVDSPLAATLRGETAGLHAAAEKGDESLRAAAERLRTLAAGMADRFVTREVTPADMRALLLDVAQAGGKAGIFSRYAAAEQATMAVAALVSGMRQADAVGKDDHAALTAALDACYEAVKHDESFKPEVFERALARVKAAIPRGR